MNDFDEITAIYKQEYPEAIPLTATGGTSLQKGAVANPRAVKIAARAKAKAAVAAVSAVAQNETGRPKMCSRGITDHFRKLRLFRSFISP